ncbi:MAG TPA: discoidin domain-containing protein [Longimicrobiales bacterium]|nr:discoidin domain-containing protein [Longimicrobiales bacterium]
MRRSTGKWRLLAVAAAVLAAGCGSAPRQPAGIADGQGAVLLDGMDEPGRWAAVPASGVQMQLSAGEGRDGGAALRVDFDFQGGGGWAALRRALPVTLPENYEISFWLRADAPENTLEFKLIDESGENVWWVHRPAFPFAGGWRQVTFRRRHVTFAWGPAGGGEIRDVAGIEFAITAGTGGRGTVWIDRLALTPLAPVVPYEGTPSATATSAAADAFRAVDGDTLTAWRSAGSGEEVFTLDFMQPREYGGLIVHWDHGRRAVDYDVDVSADGTTWRTVRAVRGGAGPRDYLFMPETEARWLRLRLSRAAADAYALREITVQPLEWGESRNSLFETIAAAAPRGHYPRYLTREQSYWTLVGVSGAPEEALINEDGMVEVGKGAFSIEPFLFAGDRLVTWADAVVTQNLREGYLPIPGVSWRAEDLQLDVTAWADGPSSASVLWLRYRVGNAGGDSRAVRLFLGLRPFQVNPSWQFLNNPGGVATIRAVAYDGAAVRVDDRVVVPVTRPAGFGAARYDEGGVIRWLARGTLPTAHAVTDAFGHASAALEYAFDLAAGEARDVILAVPLTAAPLPVGANVPDAAALAAGRLAAAEEDWRYRLDRFDIRLPAGAPPLGDLVRSNVAWILINRDGAAIQPGSRSYERSWIRDGALTSAALLRVGHEDVVREFIEWYAPFQYADGKVPCCVDRRGADPVPEHDSHGQLIYLIAEYHRFTGDGSLVERMWPHVAGAVAYIDSLRHSRMTAAYREPDLLPYYGLLPESISHEGYAAKPMHSYWDNFFGLKGLVDAAYLAGVLGLDGEARRIEAMSAEFRSHVLASFQRAMALHGIDYLPGSVELGDFDATSTTVGIAPGGELAALPGGAVRATFDRYWEHFESRRDGTREWRDYTPYELRTVGTFIRLGRRQRAHEALDWFLRDVRPPAWNHWAEVVWRDPAEPRFIGDMPHGWVGSDFIRSVTDMFAYADGDTLVVGAGIQPAWLLGGDTIRVRGLRTEHGVVDYSMSGSDETVVMTFDGTAGVTAGAIRVQSPLDRPLRAAEADGRPVRVAGDAVWLDTWPARLVIRY